MCKEVKSGMRTLFTREYKRKSQMTKHHIKSVVLHKFFGLMMNE